MSPTPWTLSLALALALTAPVAHAADDEVVVRGRVVDATAGTPIAGASVRAGELQANTDEAGLFELRLPPGHASLELSADGYVDQTRPLEIGPDPVPTLEIALLPRPRFREEVEVQAAGARPDGASVLPVRPAQVLTVAGGLDNIYRVVQTMPGVAATDEFGSRLAVRGGSPDQNLTIMDGVEVHNPYRLFGLTSAFNPETVERFDFTAGGFSVKHGDRLSSLLVVENRDGSRTRTLKGSSSLSLTDGNVIFEGKLPGRAKGSWLFTTRRTYYDLVAERFIHADLPAFRDIQFKASWEPRDGQKLSLIGLRSREDADASFDSVTTGESGAFLSNVHNDLLSASFQSRVGAAGVSKSVVSWYRDSSSLTAGARFRSDGHRANGLGDEAKPLSELDLTWRHLVRDFSAREDLSLPMGRDHLVETGFELHRMHSGVLFRLTGQRDLLETNGSDGSSGLGLPDLNGVAPSHTRGGAWIEDHVRVGDALTITPGLRVDWSGLAHGATVSPRLNGTLSLGRSTRLRAAVGLFTQSPGYEKLIQSDYVVDQVNLGYERARHAILGLERDLAPGLTARVELYHKRFDGLIIGRLETEAEMQARLGRYDFPAELAGDVPRGPLVTSVPVNEGRGGAYGFDLYFSRAARGPETRLTGWASYTFGVARRESHGRTYPFEYDRRHAFSVVGNYKLGSRFTFSATGRASSGFPWTPFGGVRVSAVEEGDRFVPERDALGRLVYEVAPGGIAARNSRRLPAYARLDLRAAFRPRGEKGRWEFFVEFINALDRQNVSGVNATLDYDPGAERPRLVETSGGSIPRIPSFGVRFQFD
jgi:hypothetical protein